MDEDTYNQTIGNDFNSFQKQFSLEEHTEEIVADMDLILEGVHVPTKDPYLEMGLMILELNAPSFKYSKNYKELDYAEKIEELKKYYYSIGYNNIQMLDLISNFKKRKSK